MRARVFVFDDEPMLRKVFSAIARRCGYEVEVFRGAAACVPREGPCACGPGEVCADAILTDYNMPGMTGLDLVEHLRARGCKCRHIAIVSGFLTPEIAEKASNLGVDVFSKPVERRELELWLERCRESIPPIRRLVDRYPAGPAAELHDVPPAVPE